jgi:mRNA-degrading endonuclease RelE of RelBE toxin-antitoxin system
VSSQAAIFVGDIKKLEAARDHYRLRVGAHRILFRLDGAAIEVYAVTQRKNAYE